MASFAAAKTTAWLDRVASRDLFDLWLLARAGAIDASAAELFRRYGPTNAPPLPTMFSRAPAETAWRLELSAQTRLTVTAEEALAVVRNAWVLATRL